MSKPLSRLLSVLMCVMLLVGAVPAGSLAAPQVVSNTVDIKVEGQQDAEGEAATFVVHFIGFAGTELKSVTVPQGGSVAVSDWPSAAQDGYDFLGWSDGTETVTALEDIRQDITLTAQYVQLFTIHYENWDGTPLYSVPNVRAGTQFVAAEHYNGAAENPSREGFGFAAWDPAVVQSVSGDTTVTAAFTPLIQHTITINYIFKNQHQAHDPYVATVYDGYRFEEAVPSPAIVGYTPDQATVSVSGEIREDVNILVTYDSNIDTQYKVIHMLQDVTGDGYTADATETRTGRTGSLTQVTAADVRTTYTGFTPVTHVDTCNDYIAADGSTVIELKYDRDIHVVMFDTADGTFIPPQVGRYGAPVTAPTADPARTGYTFKKWDQPIPATIGNTDVTVTAQWTAKSDTPFTVVYLMQDPNNTNLFTYAGSEAYKGTTGTLVSDNQSWTGKSSWWQSIDRIPDTQDEYYQRSGFSYLDNDAAANTIRADGSTVVYVRFKRIECKIVFNLKSGRKWNAVYTITAPYGARIADQWINAVFPGQYDKYTWNISTSSNVFIGFVQNMPIKGYTLYGNSTGDEDFAIIYMTECASTQTASTTFGGHGYRESGVVVSFTYDNAGVYLTPEDMSQFIIKGFRYYGVRTGGTNYVNTEPDEATFTYNYSKGRYEIFVFFNRLSYTITYHSGSSVSTTAAIPYAEDISAYNQDISGQRPANIPADYMFDGWYSDAGCTVKFDGWGAGMPANNLTVYACWKKPSYQVSFSLNYEGGGVCATQTVLKNATAQHVDNPARDGYQFDYWYYEDHGAQKIFTFSMGITANLSLLAHWTAVAVPYTVRYVDDSGNPVRDADNVILTEKSGLGRVSALVTEMAPAAFNSKKQPLFPDRSSSSITLQANGALNTITFTYSRVPTVYYLVRFVDAGGTALAPDKGPIATSNATVTAQYQNINGYAPNVYQITRNLAAETDANHISQNIITFTYTKNPTGVYIVKRYLQNLNDNAYTCDESATETVTDAPLGSTAYAAQKAYTGFSFVAGISTASGVVYSSVSNPLTLRVYYNRNLVAYGASYVDADTGENIAPDTTGTARFGKTVTVFASAIAGYQLDETRNATSASIAITAASDQNHVTFYYMVRSDIAVNIRFLDEDGNNLAPPIVRTGHTDTSVRLGRSYSYTLPASDTTLVYNEELFDLGSGSAVTQSVTIAQGDNFIDYHYSPRTYALTFQLNGGAGSIAAQRHRFRDVFALPAQTPTYGDYRFEGWSENPAVLGHVYEDAAQLGAVQLVASPFTMPNQDVTLYAVWSHMEVTLRYACDTPYTGSLPASATVAVGGSVTVAGAGTLGRPGYVFAGWMRKNDAGQLVAPRYGTEAAWTHSIAIPSNTVLYASWMPVSYAITYRNNLPAQAQARFVSGNTASSYTVESAPITLASASCYGYVFVGWFTDDGYSTPAVGIPTGSTGPRTFYARFTPAAVDGLALQGYSGVYDGQAHGVTLTDRKGQLLADVDTVVYTPGNVFTDATAGPVTVTVEVWRDGVRVWAGSATVTIARKAIALAAENMETRYDGQAHSLPVTVPAGANGAVDTTDRNAIIASLTYTVGGVTVANSFTDAMPTTMVTVSATHKNYVIAPAYPTVTITRRPVTITADSLRETYDGKSHKVSTWKVKPKDKDTGLVGSDAVGAVLLSDNLRTGVGTSTPTPYGATLSSGSADNYAFQYVSGTLTVTPAPNLRVDMTAGAGTYIYDGTAHGFTVDSYGEPITLEYHLQGGGWFDLSPGEPLPMYTDVGEYKFSIRASSPNYENVAIAHATLVITPRDVTLRAGTLSVPYDGLTHTMDQWSVDPTTATIGFVGGDGIATVALFGNTRMLPGSNDVNIAIATWRAGTKPDNYHVFTVDGSIEVTTAVGSLSITADDLSLVYDGGGHRLNYTVTAPAGCPYDVYYSLNEGEWVQLASGAALPEEVGAGTYAFALKAVSPYFSDDALDNATLTITRRPVTLVAQQSLGNVYNGSAYTAVYAAASPTAESGLLAGDEAVATLLNATQTNAGTYAVSFDQAQTVIRHGTAVVTDSYMIAYQNGSLEILKAPSAADDQAATKVYDAQAAAYPLPALLDGDGNEVEGASIAWSDTPLAADAMSWNTGALPTQTDVKSIGTDGQPEKYLLYIRLTHANYTTQIVQSALTVAPATVNLTADSRADFPYTLLASGSPKVWRVEQAHWQVEGLPLDTLYAGDIITYALENNTQSTVDAGHPVTFASFALANAGHAKNYDIQTVDGFIRVVKGVAASLMTAEGFTALYDAQPHSLPQPAVSVANEDGDQIDRTGDFTLAYAVTKDGATQTFTSLPAFTDAGSYAVTVSATSALHAAPEPVTVQVTVQKRPLLVRSAVETAVYDGAQHSAALFTRADGYAPGVGHAVDVASLAMAEGGQNIGTLAGVYGFAIDPASVSVRSGATDVTANYDIQPQNGSLTITAVSVSAAQLAFTDLHTVYDGNPHSLVAPASLTLGARTIDLTDSARFTLAYTALDLLAEGATAQSEAGNPAYTPSSRHRVTLQVTDNTACLTFEPVSAVLDILKRPVTITPNSDTFTYDGLPHTVTGHDNPAATADGTGFVGGDYATLALTGNTRTRAGSNEIGLVYPTALSHGDLNNYALTLDTGTITVDPAAMLPLTLTPIGGVYNAGEYGFTLTVGEPDTESLGLSYSLDGLTWTAFTDAGDLPTHTQAGSYPLQVRAASANFAAEAQASATLMIAPRPVDVTPRSATFVYDGTLKTLDTVDAERAATGDGGAVIGTRGLIGGDDITVTLTGNGRTDAGESTVGCENAQPVGATVLGNYAFRYLTGKLTVTQRSGMNLSLTAGSGVYDGSTHRFQFESDAIGATTYYYSIDGGAETAFTDASQLPSLTDVGNLPLTVRAVNPNYASQATDSATLSVTPAPLTLRVNSATHAYDGDAHSLTAVAEGLVGGDTLAAYTLSPAEETEPGIYSVVLADGSVTITNPGRAGNLLGNYEVERIPGTLTIAGFTLEGYTGVYDGGAHGVTLTVPDAFAPLYDVTYTAGGVTGETVPMYSNAGTYPVTVTLTPKDAASGLPVLEKTESVVIAPKTATLVVTGISKVYNGQYSAIDVSLAAGSAVTPADGLDIMAGVSFTADGEPVANSFVNAGSQTVTVVSQHPNYTIAPVDATVNIARRSVTVTAGTDAKQYDEQPLTVGYTVEAALYAGAAVAGDSGLLREHTLTAALLNESRVDVCTLEPVTFDETATAIEGASGSVLGNYDVRYVAGAITITRAASLSLTLAGVEAVYDAQAHGVTIVSVMDGTRPVSPSRFSWQYGTAPEGLTADVYSATNAGDALVYVKGVNLDGNYPDVTSTARVHILKRPARVTPASAEYDYDGTLRTVTDYAVERAAYGDGGLPSGYRGLLGDDALTVSLTNASHAEPGEYALGWADPVMTAGRLANYSLESGSGMLVIHRASAGLSIRLTQDTLVYDAAAHRLAYEVTAPDGCPYTVSYALGDSETYTGVGSDGLLPAMTAVGVYAVKVRVTSDYFVDGYAAYAANTLTIEKRPLTITSETASFVYDKAEHTVSGVYSVSPTTGSQGLVHGGGIAHAVTAFGFEDGKDNRQTVVGGHEVRLDASAVTILDQSGADVTACYDIAVESGRIDVTPQASAAAETTRTVQYNGLPQGFALPMLLDAAGEPVSEPVTYLYSLNGVDFTDAPPTYSDVAEGGYTVTIRATCANYQPADVRATLNITPAPITVTADTRDDFIYTIDADGNAVMWQVTGAQLTEGVLYRGETLDYTLSNATRSDVGEQTVVLERCAVRFGAADVSTNYQLTLVNGHLTVGQGTAAAYMSTDDLTATYDGQEHTLPQPIIAVMASNETYVDQTVEYRIRYVVTRESDGHEETFTGELPHLTDAGVYRVAITATSRRHTSPVTGSATMTIAKRPLVVTSGDNTLEPFTYSGAAQQVDAVQVLEGTFAPGEDIVAYTFADGQNNENTDVCDRAVLLTAVTIKNATRDVTDNYAVSFVPGRIVIGPLYVGGGLSLTEENHVYDGGGHGIGLSDSLSTSLGTLSLSGATLPDGSGRFTLRYTVTPYGGTEGAATATLPMFTNVSLQTVTVYVTDRSGNLTVAPASADVEITRRAVTITPDSLTVPYDGTGHSVTTYRKPKALMTDGVARGNTGLVGDDDVAVALMGGGPMVNAGNYPVTWADPAAMTHGDAGNYTFLHASGALVITPATGIDLSLAADSAVYDGKAHGFTATPLVPAGCDYTLSYLDGAGNWVTVTAEMPLPTYVSAGVYPLTVRIASPNYADTRVQTATLTVRARPLTVGSGNNTPAPFTFDRLPHSVSAALVAGGTLAEGDALNAASAVFEAGLTNENTDVCNRPVLLESIRIIGPGGADVTENYTLQYAAGAILILPAAAMAQPVSDAVGYDGQPHAFPTPAMTDAEGNALDGVSYAYSLVALNAGDEGWQPVTAMPTRVNVARGPGGAADSYRIYVRLSQSNYQPAVTTATLTIRPAPVTVTADTRDGFVYTLDGSGNPVTWTVTTATLRGTLYNAETLAYTLTQNTQALIGSHSVYVDTVSLKFGETDYTDNYAITRLPGHIAVSRGTAASQIVASDLNTVYDAQPHGIEAPAVLVNTADGYAIDRTGDFTVTYTVANAATGETWTFDDAADMAFIDAGAYSVTIHAESDLHAAPADVTVALAIAQRPLSITSENNSEGAGGTPYTYNGGEQSVRGDFSVTNLLSGHTLTDLTYQPGMENANTLACDRPVLLSGARVLQGRTDVTANYAFSFHAGRLVIAPLAISDSQFSLTDVNVVYDGLEHGISLPETVDTDIGAIDLTDNFDVLYGGSLTQRHARWDGGITGLAATTSVNPVFYDVGTYRVTVYLVSRNGCFAVEPVTATVTITPAPLAVRYGTVSENYTGETYTVPRQIEGLMARDAVSLLEKNRTGVNATYKPDGTPGPLNATCLDLAVTDAEDTTVDRSGNYEITVTDGSLEIKPIPLTIRVEDQSFTYNAAEHIVSDVTSKGLILDHVLEATLGGNRATHVVDGQQIALLGYRIYSASTGEDVTDNYTVSSTMGTLSVTPAPLTLTVTSLSITYDGLTHQPDMYASGGLMGGDGVEAYTLLGMPQRAVGTYANIEPDLNTLLLLNENGMDVTADYTVSTVKGRLVIVAPTASYSVRYYYDGVLAADATATLSGVLGSTVTAYPPRRLNGYALDAVSGLPLKLVKNADENVIRVYYVSVPRLISLDDLAIPLGAGGLSFEVGLAVE